MTAPRPTGLRRALERGRRHGNEQPQPWELVSTPQGIPVGYLPPKESRVNDHGDGDLRDPQDSDSHDERANPER